MSEDANQSIMIVTSDIIWLPPPPKGPNDLVHIYMYCAQVNVMADRNIHCLSPPPLMDPNDTCTIPGRGCIRLCIGAPFKI